MTHKGKNARPRTLRMFDDVDFGVMKTVYKKKGKFHDIYSGKR